MKIVDISPEIHEDIAVFPGDTPFTSQITAEIVTEKKRGNKDDKDTFRPFTTFSLGNEQSSSTKKRLNKCIFLSSILFHSCISISFPALSI